MAKLLRRGALSHSGISDFSDANAITIDSDEKVQIGGTSYQTYGTLRVSGNQSGGASDPLGTVEFTEGTTVWNSIKGFRASSGGSLQFLTRPDNSNAVSAKMTILNNGYVGIGTTGPTHRLTLKADGTTEGNKILKSESNGGGNNDAWYIKNLDDAKFYVENVGSTNGAYLLYNSTSGWTSYSDRRWKTDWTPISGSLEKLNKLEVAKFHNLKGESPDNLTKTEPKDGDNEKWNIGVSAQDCTSAGLGDLVDNPSDGANGIDETKRKGVSYNELTAVCIQAIQELTAKNDALETENTALKTRMDALETENTALKTRMDALEARVTALEA